jgi:hypothetical protein
LTLPFFTPVLEERFRIRLPYFRAAFIVFLAGEDGVTPVRSFARPNECGNEMAVGPPHIDETREFCYK